MPANGEILLEEEQLQSVDVSSSTGSNDKLSDDSGNEEQNNLYNQINNRFPIIFSENFNENLFLTNNKYKKFKINCNKIYNTNDTTEGLITKLSDNFDNCQNKKMSSNDEKLPRWVTHPIRSEHEKFIYDSINEIINSAVFDATERNSKLTEWKEPIDLLKSFDMSLKSSADSDYELNGLIKNVIQYSVKTGHPYFINQLYSAVDPYALVGQWLTDALNPSVYTFEVAPVFIMMEEIVLKEMRKYVGFPADNGDGIFCPGGSIANGYAISCARYKFLPEIKMKGLSALPRLVIFTSEDSHYSVQKLASFMGIGIENVYKIKTDKRGKMIMEHLESEIERAKSEGGKPFLVFATAGTTVLGAFDPIEKISEICKKNQLWFHVDAAWGGGALLSPKYRHLLKGIESADSVTWNPHKMLCSAQQCSTFLTKHPKILAECHSTNAAYLFQKDKFYDTKYDTGDKHIQCGRRADVLKFWFMWRAKGTNGLTAHVEKIFEMAEFFTNELKSRDSFEMVLEDPECTNISFWFIPPSLRGTEKNQVYYDKLHKVAPKIKERMMKNGSMMITYQSIKGIPNFFRLVLQNSIINKNDMLYFITEIEKLGSDL